MTLTSDMLLRIILNELIGTSAEGSMSVYLSSTVEKTFKS